MKRSRKRQPCLMGHPTARGPVFPRGCLRVTRSRGGICRACNRKVGAIMYRGKFVGFKKSWRGPAVRFS